MSLLYRPSPVPFVPHVPDWRQPLYLHYKPLMRVLAPRLATLHGRVVDVGCGLQPYRALLSPAVTEYVGVDREGPLCTPDVVGSIESLPFEARTFDGLMSTQVLEHVTQPHEALRECERVLRPGARMVLTVPGVWPAHEIPHDYWRFTRYGLLDALTRAGFERVEIELAGGLWASVGQLINLELQRGRWLRELVPLVNLGAGWLDKRGATEELALAWVVTAHTGEGTRGPR
ncbi:MAG: class I SAM-dependent methyltransferase [Deltaproteobacteria bacterium]|nr:class I SAM-dependent methyltransferase [Deltaproteobacteria bacterium]